MATSIKKMLQGKSLISALIPGKREKEEGKAGEYQDRETTSIHAVINNNIFIYRFTHQATRGGSSCFDNQLPGSYQGRVSDPGWWGESQLPEKLAHSPCKWVEFQELSSGTSHWCRETFPEPCFRNHVSFLSLEVGAPRTRL